MIYTLSFCLHSTGPVKSHTKIIIPIIPIHITIPVNIQIKGIFKGIFHEKKKMVDSIVKITALWAKQKLILLYLFACATHNVDKINR